MKISNTYFLEYCSNIFKISYLLKAYLNYIKQGEGRGLTQIKVRGVLPKIKIIYFFYSFFLYFHRWQTFLNIPLPVLGNNLHNKRLNMFQNLGIHLKLIQTPPKKAFNKRVGVDFNVTILKILIIFQ